MFLLLLIGLFMALQPKIIACGNSIASFAMAVRFLTGPAVMAAASIAVGLRGTLLHIAIVQVINSTYVFVFINFFFFTMGNFMFFNMLTPIGCTSTRNCSVCVR